MIKNLLYLLVFCIFMPLAHANKIPKVIDKEIHQKCINARDYSGCVKVFSGLSTERQLTAFSPSEHPGTVIAEFQALKGSSGCEVVLYERAADFCGDLVGRNSITSWSSYQIHALLGICIKDADIFVKYLGGEGAAATTISFVNKSAIKKFDSKFLAWSKISPIRIEGNC